MTGAQASLPATSQSGVKPLRSQEVIYCACIALMQAGMSALQSYEKKIFTFLFQRNKISEHEKGLRSRRVYGAIGRA